MFAFKHIKFTIFYSKSIICKFFSRP